MPTPIAGESDAVGAVTGTLTSNVSLGGAVTGSAVAQGTLTTGATARGTRTRSGSISVVAVAVHCTGSRVRSGFATPSTRLAATATGARRRAGFAFGVVISAGGGGGGTISPRWQFWDPISNEVYSWETNPNDGGSPDRKRTLTTHNTLAVDGTPIILEGEEPIWQITLKGVILSKAHYDALAHWFKKRRLVLLSDDLGRQMQVVPETITFTRAPTAHRRYRHTYTASLRLCGYGTGSITSDPDSTLVLA